MANQAQIFDKVLPAITQWEEQNGTIRTMKDLLQFVQATMAPGEIDYARQKERLAALTSLLSNQGKLDLSALRIGGTGAGESPSASESIIGNILNGMAGGSAAQQAATTKDTSQLTADLKALTKALTNALGV